MELFKLWDFFLQMITLSRYDHLVQIKNEEKITSNNSIRWVFFAVQFMSIIHGINFCKDWTMISLYLIIKCLIVFYVEMCGYLWCLYTNFIQIMLDSQDLIENIFLKFWLNMTINMFIYINPFQLFSAFHSCITNVIYDVNEFAYSIILHRKSCYEVNVNKIALQTWYTLNDFINCFEVQLTLFQKFICNFYLAKKSKSIHFFQTSDFFC